MTKEEAIKVLSESIHDGSKVPWDKIVEAVHLSIEALSQPSLPSNLDEAAKDSWAVYEYRESPKGLYSTCYVDGFKAGAKLMAGQGVTKEAVIGMATEEIFINVSQQTLNELDLFPGDKVIVQIRKKE